jgi:uncharacterized protein (TIGR02646 family)
MLRLPDAPLPAAHDARLRAWQKAIDDLNDYRGEVEAAKRSFKSRNSKRNATFNGVRAVLTSMCSGARRCAYCEDSVADEVEHIRPKDLFPRQCFEWKNYVYACGPCNGPKNNQFAILRGRPLARVDVSRRPADPIVAPPDGVQALIDPRVEDPMDFLFLDLKNTFAFTPALRLNARDKLRAEYTIEVLRLNRDYLIDARRTAFGSYRARLEQYIQHQRAGAAVAQLQQFADELGRVHHRTVWKEMQRQQAMHPALANLFASAPEALGW